MFGEISRNMRLAAIYIKDHFLFDEPQTINLGGKNIYTFDPVNDNEIKITKVENNDFIDGFWGNNISLVSAIVGGNGVGKTSMLYEIFFNNKSDENFIYIIEIDNDIIYNESLVSLLKPWHQIFKIDGRNETIKLPIQKNHLGYSIIDNSNFKNNNEPLIYNCLNFENQTDSKFETYFLQIKKIFHFLMQEDLIMKLNLKLEGDVIFFKNFSFKPTNVYYPDLFIEKEMEICSQKFKEYISRENFFKLIETKKHKSFLYDLDKSNKFENQDSFSKIKVLFLAKIYTIKYTEIKDKNKTSFIEFLYKSCIIKKIKNTKFYLETIKLILFYDFKNEENIFLTDSFKFIELFFNKIESNLTFEIKKESEENIFELLKNYFEVERFLKVKQISISLEFLDNYLVFEPTHPISQGEYFLIQLFSNLFNFKDEKTKYILLDEADLGFNPKWKKKFINIIISILPDIFQSSKVNPIQIIFTTHDPITLSDIPNSNIVYLKKDNNSKTEVLKGDQRPTKSFGANITDLLADNFFIDDGLIGDFAKAKIEETIDWLNKQKELKFKENYTVNEDDFDKHEKLINIVDEPIIQRKLAEMLDELKGNNKIEKEIAQKQIEFLKTRYNLE